MRSFLATSATLGDTWLLAVGVDADVDLVGERVFLEWHAAEYRLHVGAGLYLWACDLVLSRIATIQFSMLHHMCVGVRVEQVFELLPRSMCCLP